MTSWAGRLEPWLPTVGAYLVEELRLGGVGLDDEVERPAERVQHAVGLQPASHDQGQQAKQAGRHGEQPGKSAMHSSCSMPA